MSSVGINYDREDRLFRLTCLDHRWEIFVRGEHDAHAEAEQHEALRHSGVHVQIGYDGRHDEEPDVTQQRATTVEDEQDDGKIVSAGRCAPSAIFSEYVDLQDHWNSLTRHEQQAIRATSLFSEETLADALVRSIEENTPAEWRRPHLDRSWVGHVKVTEDEYGIRAETTCGSCSQGQVVEQLTDYIRALGTRMRLDTWPCCGGIRPRHLPGCEDTSHDPCAGPTTGFTVGTDEANPRYWRIDCHECALIFRLCSTEEDATAIATAHMRNDHGRNY